MGWLGAILGGVVGFLVGGPVGAVIGAGLGATKVGEKVVNSVMDFVLSPFMPKIPEGGADAAAREQGVLIQRTGSTISIPVVYGLRKLGGAITYAETGSTNNQYLWVAYVFAEGQIEGLHELWLDDVQLVDAAGGPGYIQRLNAGEVVSVDSGKFSGRAQFRWYPGVYYSDPSKSPVATAVKSDVFANAPSFTNQMVYNGLAVLFARYEWKEIKTQADADANPFKGSIPEAQAVILGKRVASLLTDSTESLVYDQTAGDPTLNRYSTNPAEVLLDYLRNPRYGKGLLNSDIDWPTWRTAARKFNQTVTYLDANGTPTGPIMTCNAVVDTAQSIMNNVKFLLSNSRAYMPYVQGKYKLKIEDAGNPTDILSGSAEIAMTFTKDDIVSDISYIGIDKSSKYNVVAVTYVDPNQKWSNQIVVYPETEAERQRYIDLDGGRENKYDVTYGCITNYPMAKDMARLVFNKQRRQESCVFTATSKALELEPGDNVRIQSNILNFGTDPWRVISIKINNDMTVNLGCVRNPDDMYPYVRVGEEDYVLPPYIPKGSSRVVPPAQNDDLALNPPIKAQFPPNTTGTATNPSPTDPNSIGGGGVGGGSPGGSTAGPTTATTTVPNTQPTPTPVAPLADFAAALTLKKVTSADQGNGTSIFTLTFTQPSDALYDKSTLWWRINQSSPWATIELTNKPGAGGEISINIPGLPNTYFTPYSFYVRSYATDGRGSTEVLQGTFGNVQNQTTGLIVGTGSASLIQVSAGWTVPASTIATTTPVYNDSIDYLAIVPKLPSDPRRLTLKIQQLQNTISGTINNLINGVTVYYKFKTDTYWDHETFVYPGNYTFGLLSYDLAGDFGARGTTGSLQQYDFLVRLNYSDGRAAEKQMGPATAPVEVNGTGLTVYDIFGTSSSAAASVKSVAIPTGFTLPLVEQNPTNSFAVGSDIVPVVQVSANVYANSLLFSFTPPTNSKFRGYKIRYREVIAGANTTYNTVAVGAAANSAGVIPVTIADSTYNHGKKYEWVITAQYSLSGVTTDCLNSLYGQALIPTGDANWNGIDLFAKIFTGTQPIQTTLALGNLATSFPALPTVNPKSWIKKQARAAASGNRIGDGSDIETVSRDYYYLNSWYELKFQPDGSSDNIVIYRRVYDSYGLQRTTVGANAKYWGLGAWEKKTISLSSLSTDADGWKILNVRGPIDPSLFDPYYQVSGYASRVLYANNYGPSPSVYPYGPGSSPSTNTIYPYYGVGNSAVNTGVTRYAEFIFVLATGSTEQTKGLRLTEFQTVTSGTGFRTDVDGFILGNVKKDDVVTLSDYNALDSGYARRLSEAITVSSFNNLAKGNPAYGGYGVPQYPTTGGGFSYFLRQPSSGTVTVY